MKKVFNKIDKPLLITTMIFFIFGLVMVFSASSMESYMRYGSSPYYYFFRQALFIGIGSVIFFFVTRIPIKAYKNLSYILLVAVIAGLIGLTAYGYVAKNAQSWFQLGPFNIQPSEFAKIIIIIYLAHYYNKNKTNLNNTWILIKPLIPVFIIFVLVAIQPDFGTAMVIALISFFMFFSLPMGKLCRFKFSSLIIVLVFILTIVFIFAKGYLLKPYQIERFNFKDPCERYQEESGYQLCNSFIAFKNGNITGQGIGMSTQKYLYLPESYTDFIFPIIVEEWGLIAGIIIIILYLFIIYRMYIIARKANDLTSSLIAYGICMYYFLHVVINIMGVMGLGPLTGLPLPFLSYGGSYVINLMISLGLVQRVAIESNKKKKKQKEA